MRSIHLFRGLLPVGFAALVLAGPLQAKYLDQPKEIGAQGAYRHPASGMIFPVAVGEFRRTSVVQYDEEALDVSAGYRLAPGSLAVVATVYVYPAPKVGSGAFPADASAQARLCHGEFKTRKYEIRSLTPSAQLLLEQDFLAPRRVAKYYGRFAIFEFEGTFGDRRQLLHSMLVVYCYVGGKWAFEYRFTYPKSFEPAADKISAFIDDLTWTIRPVP